MSEYYISTRLGDSVLFLGRVAAGPKLDWRWHSHHERATAFYSVAQAEAFKARAMEEGSSPDLVNDSPIVSTEEAVVLSVMGL